MLNRIFTLLGVIMDEKFKSLNTADDLGILNGHAFENYLEQLFEELGYSVRKTPGSGDFGADLLLAKAGTTAAVQAKQYSSEVGFDAVKEVHFARTYYNVDEAWVICTKGFTRQAREAARKAEVKLIGRDELELLMNKQITDGNSRSNEKSQVAKNMHELLQGFKSKRADDEQRLFDDERACFNNDTAKICNVFSGLKWKLINRPLIKRLGPCELEREWIVAQFDYVGDGKRLFAIAVEYGLFVPKGENYSIPVTDEEALEIAKYQRQANR